MESPREPERGRTVRQIDPLAIFDPSKPFHPLVLNYLALLMGFRKLFYRGSGLLFAEDFLLGASDLAGASEGLGPHASWTLDVTAREQLDRRDIRWLGPEIMRGVDAVDAAKIEENRADLGMYLHYAWADLDTNMLIPSRTEGAGMVVKVDDVARRVPEGGAHLHDLMVRSAGVLLVLAREMTRDLGLSTPAWEFLRHCRNGAAHGGSFDLRGKEPKLPAYWRGKTIERSLDGTPVFLLPGRPGILDSYDPILLLWDLERSTPEIPAARPSP